MSEKQEILTVILPTRDRADTLKYALETITSQENPNIEIIVSDNFSGPEVKAVVDAVDDQRLRYIRTAGRMGMSEHWDFALENVKGDWVTIVGDDDGLLPDAVDKFFELRNEHPEIKAISSANCWFDWPLEPQGEDVGKLNILYGKGYEILDSKDFIKRILDATSTAMPYIYTGGFISMELVREIKEKSVNNKFFQSIIPDFYSAMAVASVTDKYIYSHESMAIAGGSKHSNGRQHKDKKKEEIKELDFHKENSLEFHPSLAGMAVESIQLLLYESFLQSAYLREDDLGITMHDQLVTCIVTSKKRAKDDVVEYCREVAKKNNLNFNEILKQAKKRYPAYRARKLFRKFKKLLPYVSPILNKTIRDVKIRTVQDAALRAAKEVA